MRSSGWLRESALRETQRHRRGPDPLAVVGIHQPREATPQTLWRDDDRVVGHFQVFEQDLSLGEAAKTHSRLAATDPEAVRSTCRTCRASGAEAAVHAGIPGVRVGTDSVLSFDRRVAGRGSRARGGSRKPRSALGHHRGARPGPEVTTVPDASVLVAALVDTGPEGRWARSVLARGTLAGPELLLAETTNVLRRLEHAGHIPEFQAAMAHRDPVRLNVETFPFAPFATRVWALRKNLTAYDGWYAALAEALDCPLAILDRTGTPASASSEASPE